MGGGTIWVADDLFRASAASLPEVRPQILGTVRFKKRGSKKKKKEGKKWVSFSAQLFTICNKIYCQSN